MECLGITDFDNNSRLITLSAIIISGLQCINDERTSVWLLTVVNSSLSQMWGRTVACLVHDSEYRPRPYWPEICDQVEAPSAVTSAIPCARNDASGKCVCDICGFIQAIKSGLLSLFNQYFLQDIKMILPG